MVFRKLSAWIRKPHADVVHLGNLGSDNGAKTREHALKAPEKRFLGIDTTKSEIAHTANWRQHTGDFISGLRTLKDNSAELITSELALGHYGPKFNSIITVEYNLKVLKYIYRKLKPAGRLEIIVAGIKNVSDLRQALERTKFRVLEIRPITEAEAHSSPYTERYYSKPGDYLVQRKSIVKIVAGK
ncbi:MAG: hypothetical protein PHH82_02755 [Candidatus ainarchaeum sp.]|nr:hypothetical protein [Candidatus ainarchaeum sp.]